jgi:hypothetical protein
MEGLDGFSEVEVICLTDRVLFAVAAYEKDGDET